ncbi:hypothetical protein Tco_1239058 [Tanacetum coccineum]
MCKEGSGRLGYARVLVEVDAGKEYLDKNEINYVDAMKKMKMTKWVKVEYSWKPDRCNHCKVFGHTFNYCKAKQMNERSDSNPEARVNGNKEDNEGFVEVKNRKNKQGSKVGMNNGTQANSKEGENGKTKSTQDKGKSCETNDGDKRDGDLNNKNNMENTGNMSPPSLEKLWNVGPKKIMELWKSANKYVVLSKDMNNLEFDGDHYFKHRWNAVNRMDESSDEEDIIEENNAANDLVADEIGGGDSQLLN